MHVSPGACQQGLFIGNCMYSEAKHIYFLGTQLLSEATFPHLWVLIQEHCESTARVWPVELPQISFLATWGPWVMVMGVFRVGFRHGLTFSVVHTSKGTYNQDRCSYSGPVGDRELCAPPSW